MLTIELDLKTEEVENIKEALERRGFDISDDGYDTLYVHGISQIGFAGIGDMANIELKQSGSMHYYVILLSDIKYFEIYSEEMKS